MSGFILPDIYNIQIKILRVIIIIAVRELRPSFLVSSIFVRLMLSFKTARYHFCHFAELMTRVYLKEG